MSTEQAALRASAASSRDFEDGLGRRYCPAPSVADSGQPLEVLCVHRDLSEVPAFEFALRERVSRLSAFRHPYYTRIRKVDKLSDGTLVLVSDRTTGARLSAVLAHTDPSAPPLDLNGSLYLVRQLVLAASALHEYAQISNGGISPERLFLTPSGRLCVAEYVMGAALEQLKYSRERYWRDLRVGVPMHVGQPRFDERTDLTQVGLVALALVLARPLAGDEYPDKIERLLQEVPANLSEWLRRMLQLDVRRSFRSLSEAQKAFDMLLSEDGELAADGQSFEAFLAPGLHRFSTSPTVAAKPVVPPPTSSDFAQAEENDLVTDPEEEQGEMNPSYSRKRSTRRANWIVAALIVAIATTAGVVASRHRFAQTAVAATGTLTLNTNPPGAYIEVDGTPRGQTPAVLELSAGEHSVVVRGTGDPRTVPIVIAGGAQITQYIELPTVSSSFGQLQVRTAPAGARISVDGTPLGKTPITVADLAPGEHIVTLESDLASVTQNVTIEAGATAALVVPMAAAPGAMLSGWVTVKAPFVMDLFEEGRLLGTTGIDRIMLPSGRHDLQLVSEPLGYREARTVQVTPGKTTSITVTLPKGSISINAVPWATVFIDGASVGDTPIGNLPITIGPHEMVFRNPELGEQRRVVNVTSQSPARVSIDMTKK